MDYGDLITWILVGVSAAIILIPSVIILVACIIGECKGRRTQQQAPVKAGKSSIQRHPSRS